MEHNLFEELQAKKQQLIAFATKAVEYGWIPATKEEATNKGIISLEEIKEKIEKDTLTIGVIGQMKCGKSTFLNSFVFKDDVLPAATTPMTAALSVITYGEKEHIVAEFYTADEWAEQKMQALREESEATDTLDVSKIKAAKELVSKANKLGTSLDSYLGKTKEDSFDQLIEYVGAEGKYVSITKSVTIYYPNECLKGVEVVDTPGFNDPIVSREERTKTFLAKADVVIMMLYAGRPFDATDRDIIFKNVRQCGIGKVLVGINKYDIPYCSETNPEDENQIKDYVKQEIKKACRECNDNTLVEILNDIEPITLSAEMALLSELPMSKITSSDSFEFAWKRHCSNFGISTQTEMYKWSHIDQFIKAVQNMIDTEKGKILFKKPINAILVAGEKLKTDNDDALSLLSNKISLLLAPDSDLEEKEEKLLKAKKRISKKIHSLEEDIDVEIRNLVRKGRYELEDIVDASCHRMLNMVQNEWGQFKSFDSISPRLDTELQALKTRKLKRATENISKDCENKIKSSIKEFFSDTEDILLKYLPDFDNRDFTSSTQRKINMEMETSDLFSFTNEDNEEITWGNIIGSICESLLNGSTFGIWGKTMNFFTHNSTVTEVSNTINSISGEFDPEPYLNQAFKSKDKIIEYVRNRFINELIEPLQEQLTSVRSKINNKEQELHNAEEECKILEERQRDIARQIEDIQALQTELS
ncbi:dynamin family protein [Segatella salivae]|uniref:dynamin family protein n=1 Tax=Segatella salivae TaxID=228604 RepID=UPI00248D9ED9|nr:dynamin family protein [Segatella salivae]